MIKVLRTPVARVQCGKCLSVLEYSNADLRRSPAALVYGEFYIVCPVCGIRIYDVKKIEIEKGDEP